MALPNFLHYSFSKKALEHGKHVIVEKPITVNAAELTSLIAIAKEKDLIVLEAMNIFYLPAYKALKDMLAQIGTPKIISFNYSQYSSRYDAFKQGEVLPAFDYRKAGGSLMDINVYNINGIIGLFGEPKSVHYFANIERRIDTSGILVLDYGNFHAVCVGAKDCQAPVSSTIQGEKGYIRFDKPINQIESFTIVSNNGQEQIFSVEEPKHRLYYEFVEFIHMIDEGRKTEADAWLNISLMASRIMQESRSQQGIDFELLK